MTNVPDFAPEFTILLPCLNEQQTLPMCIREIQTYLSASGTQAEILVADNNSTDDSGEIAKRLGARVVTVPERGYGNALSGGISEARGRYIIIGDCDYSYDFSKLQPFVDALREGYDFVIGNRFSGSMEAHAMPFLHRYIGIPFLSFLGRKRFHTFVYDFHCGLRGCSTSSVRRLHLQCPGMEFASEMIARYAEAGASIKELPIDFRCDKRKGASHLRTFADGVRHLYFILTKKPLH